MQHNMEEWVNTHKKMVLYGGGWGKLHIKKTIHYFFFMSIHTI